MFLTLEDPRAKIKGSRDPLGLQPVWVSFGRHLVSNLTTVTDSVREFTTLLLGRYLGQHLVEQGISNEEEAIDIFLRAEQLAAYSRPAPRRSARAPPGQFLRVAARGRAPPTS